MSGFAARNLDQEPLPVANPGACARFRTAGRARPTDIARFPPEARCHGCFAGHSGQILDPVCSGTGPKAALFFSTFAPYIEGAGSPAMEINCRRNKPFGPGGSTRRLHPSPPRRRASAGANQDRRGRKGRVFSRYGSAVIGLCNSCKRQLCSGCSGCVTQFERPRLKS
jgi:hypothetical protein